MASIRQAPSSIAPNLDNYRPWFDTYLAKLPEADAKLLQNALSLAEAHYPAAALTSNGEPLLSNLLGAAEMVADMDLLPDAVAATLLTDISSYCPSWQEKTTEACNADIASLVKGIDEVQKLTHFAKVDSLATPEERAEQAETMRKMLLAMVSDIRVVLIKLALRTRTMQFIGTQPDSPEKRALAKETLDIFAPLANRLGVWQLKWQLEDLGFRHQNPEEYKKIARLLDEKRTERLEYIENFLNALRTELDKYGIRYDVAGRPKHIYSIYKKMVKKKLDFDGLYDIRAVRILVDSVPECYTTLGLVHSLWQPIPGEFDDYIAYPKGNGYKSLHTVVVGPEDKGVEVQIRTFDMYKFRSMGVQDPKKEAKEWTTKNDVRVTPVGRVIRKTSLDELPQFWNVLKGDMSLIGPRPERPLFVEKFKEEIPRYMIKHQVRPGITGWAQVNGFRGDTSIRSRIEHDLYYIENWSLGLDIKILFLTFFKGFVNKNAY